MIVKNTYISDDIISAPKNLDKFPIEVFPKDVSDYIIKLEKDGNIDRNLVAGGVLFSASTILGNKLVFSLSDTWYDTPQLWIVLIQASGGLKSQAMKIATKYLKTINKASAKENEDNEVAYAFNLERFNNLSPEQKRADEKPIKPIWVPPILINNTTSEGLAKHSKNRPGGIGRYYSEFTQFFTSMNQYKGGGGSDLEFNLNMYDNDSYNSLRAGDDNNILDGNIYSPIIGGIQNRVLQKIAGDTDGTGFYQRFLYIPVLSNNKKLWNVKPYKGDIAVNAEDDVDPIYALMERLDGWVGESKFLTIFDDDAANGVSTYLNYIENISYSDESTSEINAKIQTYFGRLTAILSAIYNRNKIELDIVKNAILLTEWFRLNSFDTQDEIETYINLDDIFKRHNAKTKKTKVIALHNETKLSGSEIARKIGCNRQYVSKVINQIK